MSGVLKQHIKKYNLFDDQDKILLAVSGGMDSMAMMHMFKESGFGFGVAHCNFKLRGEESDADEDLVRKTAREMGVEFYCKSFDTLQYAESKGISIQMAARELRYSWFEEIRSAHHFIYIATAHHKDDNTETILLNITRGTGLRGLAGIPVKADRIIRPLACFSRDEIYQYVDKNNIAFREDVSNTESKYYRNKLRHKVIPVLREINPALDDAMLHMSGSLSQANDLLEFFVSREFKDKIIEEGVRIKIPIRNLLFYPGTEYLLFELLRPYNFQPPVIKDIAENLTGQAGKVFYSSSHVCLRDRDYLIISPQEEIDHTHEVIIEDGKEEIFLPGGIMLISITHSRAKTEFPSDPNEILLDADKLDFPLVLRHPKEGDSFHPLGMSGKKKISDLFIDLKIPRNDKRKIWLLTERENIVWVVGHRLDDRFKITFATEKIMNVKYIPDII